MTSSIRGIKCSLDYYKLTDFLRFLSTNDWAFYIPWCLLDGLYTLREHNTTLKDLINLDKYHIWELELQCFPKKSIRTDVINYQGFLSSSSICYLLYFDCGYLEIYTKSQNDYNLFWEYLSALHAEDLLIITDSNDTRTQFTVG